MTKDVHDEAPLDQRADVADNMAEEGSAVLVQVGEEDDMTNVVGTVNVQVPGDDGGGAAKVQPQLMKVTLSKSKLMMVGILSI